MNKKERNKESKKEKKREKKRKKEKKNERERTGGQRMVENKIRTRRVSIYVSHYCYHL